MVPALSRPFMLWSPGGPRLPDLQRPLLREGAPGASVRPGTTEGEGDTDYKALCRGQRAHLGSLSQFPGRALLLLQLFWGTTAGDLRQELDFTGYKSSVSPVNRAERPKEGQDVPKVMGGATE